MKLERVTPEAVSVPPRAVANFMNAVKNESHEIHNLMLIRNGKVFFERSWEPYGQDYRHQLFSLSKSFTSTAVGFAVQEGLLTVDTKLSEIFTGEFNRLGSKVDSAVRNMTVKNLLTMSTGMEAEYWDETGSGGHIISFLSGQVKDTPGETFRYSSIATFMCSAAVTRLTGMPIVEYLTPRLFKPLGIENTFWSKDAVTGANMGGFGLYITVEDIAKFGQFILQKGMWNGKQLLSAEWIEEATGKQIENGRTPDDWGSGYGYQFWRCVPRGVFRGDGMYGQFCLISPEHNMVIAVNSNVHMQNFLNLVWKMLEEIETLPVTEADSAELDAVKNLSLPDAFKPGDEYPVFRAMYETDTKNFNIYFDFNGRDGVVALSTDKDKPPYCAFFFERGAWSKGAAPFSSGALMIDKFISSYGYIGLSNERAHRVTTFGSWDGRVFHGVTWYYETAARNEFRCTFSGDFSEVVIEQRGGAYDEGFKEVYKGKRVKD